MYEPRVCPVVELTERSVGLTSSMPTATERATPVHRRGRLSFATLHESLWSCSRMLVSWNSHCWTGMRNLDAPNELGGIGWPGRGTGRLDGLRPSMSWICLGAYSLDPRNTYDLGHSEYPSSCTWAMVP